MQKDVDVFTLERTDKLPLRFSGTLMATYTTSSSTMYTLYITDEFIQSATFVVEVSSDNFSVGKVNTVFLFELEEDVRAFLVEKLGAYNSLIFQQELGYEEVEFLE
jgi:hypothetical protein